MTSRDIERETRSRVFTQLLIALASMDDDKRRVLLAWMIGQLSVESLLAMELRLRRRGVIES
jgi:hypothetical protein